MIARLLSASALALSLASPALAQEQNAAAPKVVTTQESPAVTQQSIRDLMPASSLIGKSAVGAQGEDIGSVNDILISPDGRVNAAVVDVGGFLGLGERQVAVEWDAITINPAEEQVMVKMSKEELAAAPEFSKPEGMGAGQRAETGAEETQQTREPRQPVTEGIDRNQPPAQTD